jgi:outer membrane protein insertion porin family
VAPFTLAGNKQLLFNFELVFPILDRVGLRGVVFYDAGNFWTRSQDFFASQPPAGPLNLVHSVGLGVRWFSPIGPVRLEWGLPLTRQPGDEPFLFQLSVGASF